MENNNSPSKSKSFKFSYKEVAEALIKAKGIEEGIWSLGFVVAHKAGNVNDGDLIHPTVFNIIAEVTLSKVEKENNLSVDAGKIGSRIKVVH